MKPTVEFYDLFQNIFDYLNENLFENKLPNCMIIITRKNNVFGYYAKGRWINSDNEKTDELAINPLFFNKRPLLEILQTMAHEMCHLWQEHFGTTSRRTYHNQEWGNKMISIGLMPSNTGEEGGKKTGQQMMEFPIPNGLFLEVAQNLIENSFFKKLWFDISFNLSVSEINLNNSSDALNSSISFDNVPEFNTDLKPPKDKSKLKYQCPVCSTKIWGKQDLYIICGGCNKDFKLA